MKGGLVSKGCGYTAKGSTASYIGVKSIEQFSGNRESKAAHTVGWPVFPVQAISIKRRLHSRCLTDTDIL